MITADQLAVLAPAFGELGGAVATAIAQCRGFPVGAEKQHDVFAEKTKRLWPGSEIVKRDHRVPKSAQNLLFRRQHVDPPNSVRRRFLQTSRSIVLSCQDPSASFVKSDYDKKQRNPGQCNQK